MAHFITHRLAPSLLLSSLVFALACGPGEHDGAPPTHLAEGEVTLTLEERSGTGALGWSLTDAAHVPAEEAELTLSSFDCGARGRWVFLDGHGVMLCRAADLPAGAAGCASSQEVGGTNPAVAVGEVMTVVREDRTVATLTLVDRTETDFAWYETPDAPFHVVLEVEDAAASF